MIPECLTSFYGNHESKAVTSRAMRFYLFELELPDHRFFRIHLSKQAIRLNEDLSVSARIPGLFAVGDEDRNGADELLCIEGSTERVVQIALFPMDCNDALDIAVSMQSLIEQAKKTN